MERSCSDESFPGKQASLTKLLKYISVQRAELCPAAMCHHDLPLLPVLWAPSCTHTGCWPAPASPDLCSAILSVLQVIASTEPFCLSLYIPSGSSAGAAQPYPRPALRPPVPHSAPTSPLPIPVEGQGTARFVSRTKVLTKYLAPIALSDSYSGHDQSPAPVSSDGKQRVLREAWQLIASAHDDSPLVI